jgi:hypothetical protein
MIVSLAIACIIILIIRIYKHITDWQLQQKVIFKSILRDRLRSCNKEINELKIRKECPRKIRELEDEKFSLERELDILQR